MNSLHRYSIFPAVTAALFVFFLCIPSALTAEEETGIKVVVSEGRAALGEDRTIREAKAIAMNNARRNALEEAVGVAVESSTVLYNSDLISDLVVAATKGLIVGQKVLEETCGMEDGRIVCLARIEASVKPLPQQRKGSFKIKKASVRRPGKKGRIRVPVFQQGDEVQVTVTASEEAYMNIFNVDQNGNIVKLYPNEYVKYAALPPGEEFVFPDDSMREMGLRVRVATLDKLEKSVESVVLIATKEKVDFLEDEEIETPTVTDLMKELSGLDRSLWAEKTVGYEVRR